MPSRRSVSLEWSREGLKFAGRGTEPETPLIQIDGDNNSAPGPMLLLLLACASCSASDVVLIMKKMKVDLKSLRVTVDGLRRDEEPRRYTEVTLHFTLAGDGLDQKKADRSVALSVSKYCSALASLAPDIAIAYSATVEE